MNQRHLQNRCAKRLCLLQVMGDEQQCTPVQVFFDVLIGPLPVFFVQPLKRLIQNQQLALRFHSPRQGHPLLLAPRHLRRIMVEPMAKEGRLRVLAVSPKVTAPTFASAPTLQSQGFDGYESAVWLGLVATAGTPPAVVQRLNDEVGKALKDPAMRQAMLAHGALPYHASPAAFAQRIAAERATWGPAIRRLGIQPN